MSEGLGSEAYAQQIEPVAVPPPTDHEHTFRRSLAFIAIAAGSAGLAFAVVRSTLARPPADPTTERIQQLIDEANRLLKALDDKKPD